MKICSKCKIEKNKNKFSNCVSKRDGLYSYCKKCAIEYSREYRKSIKGKESEKRYKSSNKWKAVKYKHEHSTKRKEWRKEYLQTEHSKKYRKKYNRIYSAQRLKTDLKFKLIHSFRNRLNSAFKNNQKYGSAIDRLGCSVEFAKKYLESQFAEGMTWNNWGTGANGKGMKEWHIDHIIPLASFDLSKPEEQKKACHYSNLRPLWATENISKGNKI